MENYFILTGGPGSGKSTVARELRTLGMKTVDEVARDIIREEIGKGGCALPWGDTHAYSRLMLERSLRDFEAHRQTAGLVVFDRGIPDVLGYTRLIGLDGLPGLEKACAEQRYNENVFFFPPWREIYQTDSERKQDWATAVRTYEVMAETYGRLGYRPAIVPFLPPKERAEWIIRQLVQK